MASGGQRADRARSRRRARNDDPRDFRSREWREAWPEIAPELADLIDLRARLYDAMDGAGGEYWTHLPCKQRRRPCRVCACGLALRHLEHEADRRAPVLVERRAAGQRAAQALEELAAGGDPLARQHHELYVARYGRATAPRRGRPVDGFKSRLAALLKTRGGYSAGEIAAIVGFESADAAGKRARK